MRSVSNELTSNRTFARMGAMHGLIAWVVYAVLECCFACLLPRVIRPSYVYVPLDRLFLALLFIVYPASGVMLGALCGLALRRLRCRHSVLAIEQPDRILASAAVFTVALAFSVNLWFRRPLTLALVPALAISSLVTVVLAGALFSDAWSGRLRFLSNPWLVGLLLLGVPGFTREWLLLDSPAVKATASLAYPAALALTGYLFHRHTEYRRNAISSVRAPRFLIHTICWLTATALAVLGIAFCLMRQQPYQRAIATKPLSHESSEPNIILITLDTVRADHLSLYGYKRDTTPNLKAWAKEATLYNRAVAASNMTLPSHASLFTGLYPSFHGADYTQEEPLGRPLAERFHTLAEILSRKGYVTKGVVANYGYLVSCPRNM